MPVAGPVGQGSAALASELGPDKLKIIGVDVDQYDTDPEHKGVFLTSVLKRMDSTVIEAIKEAKDGTFKGGVTSARWRTTASAWPRYHDLDGAVPAELKAEIDELKKQIIDGKVDVEDVGCRKRG